MSDCRYVISPEQSSSKWYLKALSDEVAIWSRMDYKALEKSRINHPVILDYRARMLGNNKYSGDYADWTGFLLEEYGYQESCLSLGSGYGRVERYLIQRGFTKSFDTIELNQASNRTLTFKEPRIHAREGDLNFVEIKPSSYDFILCHGILHHLINLEHVLDQINLALKPNGILLIYEYVGESRWQFSNDRIRVLKTILPEVKFKKPSLWRVKGFESIRSGELLSLINTKFGSACERSVYYGGVYFPFIVCTKPRADILLKHVVALDEEASREGLIQPSYHMGIYRKSGKSCIPVKPWSDKEIHLHLSNNEPTIVKFMRLIKRGFFKS